MPSNLERAERAEKTVANYSSCGLDTDISDLICDLMHLCERDNIDFENRLAIGEIHYNSEVDDEKED